MGKKDARVDAYIAKPADFAKLILTYIRKLVHQGCPGVAEKIKWGSPRFDYRGIFCGMAAFKPHCAFGFWNRALKIERSGDAMGQFGRSPRSRTCRATRSSSATSARRRARRRGPGSTRPPRQEADARPQI